MSGLLLVQIIDLPVKAVFAASLGDAVSVKVPSSTTDWLFCKIVTDATGTSATVTTVLAVIPSEDAVMLAVPTAMPVIRPLASTVATFSSSLVQLTVRPFNSVRLASRNNGAIWF